MAVALATAGLLPVARGLLPVARLPATGLLAAGLLTTGAARIPDVVESASASVEVRAVGGGRRALAGLRGGGSAGRHLTRRRREGERRNDHGEGFLLASHGKVLPFAGWDVRHFKARLGTRPVLSSRAMCVLTNFMERSAKARISLFSVFDRTCAMTVNTAPWAARNRCTQILS